MALQINQEQVLYARPAEGEPLLSEEDIEYLFEKVGDQPFEPHCSSLLDLT